MLRFNGLAISCELQPPFISPQTPHKITTELRARIDTMAGTTAAAAAAAAETEERRVCVTGGNGFIGSWLVRALLEKGYAVTATIQPGADAAHLRFLPGGGGDPSRLLLIHEADLLDAPALAAAVAGCRAGVFHVASPCTLEDPADPQRELVLPAVQGTLNVLEAARAAGVRRVVITSSISAMVPNPRWARDHPGRPVDEECWTDLDYCKARKKWYPVSKTMAEKAAWEYAEKHKLDVVTINPSTCLGPLLQPGLNASSAVLQQLLQGSKDTHEYHWLGCVHVCDVAAAQVLLLETPNASGRYLCTNGIYQFKDFAETVAKLCPGYNVESFTEETQPGLVACKDAAKKLIDLGLVFRPREEAIKDAEASLNAKGFLGQHQLQI
ncbi:cinnamoyl-CoA reductase 1 isoform X2 [Phoenix dactylifera]|uniref:Cinnamoyl-CoA reductase 1 isoform X2 n=1 Tax=Phoenix dactylifera TaxID=42345 RepID=A0A8B7BN52_PHODC|nr:cinnamoyl-CoA reductase 1 isoform X2 [Phoenix dactylifera]